LFSIDAVKGILDEAGVQFKQNPKSLVMDCPKCGKFKLYIRRTDGRFVCFRCKETDSFYGKCEWALVEFAKLSLDEIRYKVYGDAIPQASELISLDFDNDFEFVDSTEEPTREPPVGLKELESPYGRPGLDYLLSRDVSLELAQAYGVMYWPAKAAVWFPIHQSNRLVGWQTRRIGQTKFESVTIPKSLTFDGMHKDWVLGFEHRITGSHVVVCEGPFDAIKCHDCGGNIFTLGKSISRVQMAMIQRSGVKRIYWALDPDAYFETEKLVHATHPDIEMFQLLPAEGYEDLGKMTTKGVYQQFLAAPHVDRTTLFVHVEKPEVKPFSINLQRNPSSICVNLENPYS